MSARKHRLANWGLLSIGLVAGALLLEFGVRVAGYAALTPHVVGEGLWRYDPELGWRNLENIEIAFSGPGFSYTVTHNAWGFRDGDSPESMGAATYRIALLGDSFAYGLGVDEPRTFASVLETQLPRTQVVNLAVAGYATDQAVLLMEREQARWHPDAVILLMYGNDLPHNTQWSVYTHYTKPKFGIVNGQLRLLLRPRPEPALVPHLDFYLSTHSAAYYRGSRLYRTARTYPAPLMRNQLRRLYGWLAGDPYVDPLAITEALIERLDSSVSDAGARLIVVFAVAEFQLDDPRAHAERAQLGIRLQDHGIAYLDTAPVLRDYRQSRPSVALSLDGDEHWNGVAHSVAAKATADFVESLGLGGTVSAR